MVINHLEKLFVTSDAAVIARELEVAHPAARVAVMAAEAQEREVGRRDELCGVVRGGVVRLGGGVDSGRITPEPKSRAGTRKRWRSAWNG